MNKKILMAINFVKFNVFLINLFLIFELHLVWLFFIQIVFQNILNYNQVYSMGHDWCTQILWWLNVFLTINYFKFSISLINIKVKHVILIRSRDYFSWKLIFVPIWVMYFFFKINIISMLPSFSFQIKILIKKKKGFVKPPFWKICSRIIFVINIKIFSTYTNTICGPLNHVLSFYNSF